MSVVFGYPRGTPAPARRHWPRLALDRDDSVRSFDPDGRLRVSRANITAARVNEYKGREIPDWQSHGLGPDRVYRLLRPAEELARPATVASANNIPILKRHQSITATEYDPDLVIGSTGTDANFDGTYLTNSLAVWPQTAIDHIESNEARELSAGYSYDFDPSPGVYNGQRYEGVMRNLRLQHVALVPTGRVGPDCYVGDSDPFKPRRSSMSRRRYARDQEEGEGGRYDAATAMQAIREIWMQLSDDDERDRLLDLIKEHLGVEIEEPAGGDPYGEAQDRRRRLSKDEPPPFEGRPRPGGSMDSIEAEERRRLGMDSGYRSPTSAQERGFFSRFPSAQRLGTHGFPGPR